MFISKETGYNEISGVYIIKWIQGELEREDYP